MTNNNMTASMWTVLDDSQAENLNGGSGTKIRICITRSIVAVAIGNYATAVNDASNGGNISIS